MYDILPIGITGLFLYIWFISGGNSHNGHGLEYKNNKKFKESEENKIIHNERPINNWNFNEKPLKWINGPKYANDDDLYSNPDKK